MKRILPCCAALLAAFNIFAQNQYVGKFIGDGSGLTNIVGGGSGTNTGQNVTHGSYTTTTTNAGTVTVDVNTNTVAANATNLFGGPVPTGLLTAGTTNTPGHLLVVTTNSAGQAVRETTYNGGALSNLQAAALSGPQIALTTNAVTYALTPLTVTGAASFPILNSTNWQLYSGNGATNSVYVEYPGKTNFLFFTVPLSGLGYIFASTLNPANSSDPKILENDSQGSESSSIDVVIAQDNNNGNWSPDGTLAINYGAAFSTAATNFATIANGVTLLQTPEGASYAPYGQDLWQWQTTRGRPLVGMSQDGAVGAAQTAGSISTYGQAVGIPGAMYNTLRLAGHDLNVTAGDTRAQVVFGKAVDSTGTNGGNLYLATRLPGPSAVYSYVAYWDSLGNASLGHNLSSIDSGSETFNPAQVGITGANKTNVPQFMLSAGFPYLGGSNGAIWNDGTNLTLIGNWKVTGTNFGNGAGLTNLNAGQLSGIVPPANLPGGTYTNSFQPTNANLTALAANNGGGLTNQPFAKTFSSTNGFFAFTVNSDGSTNVSFTVTNVALRLGLTATGSNGAAATWMLGLDNAGKMTTNAVPAGGGGGGNVYSNTVVPLTTLIVGPVTTNSTTNLVVNGLTPYQIGNGSWPNSTNVSVAFLRPNVANSVLHFDTMPNGPGTFTLWEDICSFDSYSQSPPFMGTGLALHLQTDGTYNYIGSRYYSGGGLNTLSYNPLYIQGENIGTVNIGDYGPFLFFNGYSGNANSVDGLPSGEVPLGSVLTTATQHFLIGAGGINYNYPQYNSNMFGVFYYTTNGLRMALQVFNQTNAAYGALGLMPGGGSVNVGGSMLVKSNLTASGYASTMTNSSAMNPITIGTSVTTFFTNLYQRDINVYFTDTTVTGVGFCATNGGANSVFVNCPVPLTGGTVGMIPGSTLSFTNGISAPTAAWSPFP